MGGDCSFGVGSLSATAWCFGDLSSGRCPVAGTMSVVPELCGHDAGASAHEHMLHGDLVFRHEAPSDLTADPFARLSSSDSPIHGSVQGGNPSLCP